MNKDKAERARAVAELWYVVKGSDLGTRLDQEFARIEEQAIRAALSGETPETFNTVLERRGEFKVVQRLRRLLADIEREAADAAAWQAQNVEESLPAVGTPASERQP